MTVIPVIEVKNGKVKVKDYDQYLELLRRRRNEQKAEVLAAFGEGDCEQVCEEHGGVDECGKTYIWCNDGTAWLRNP